ncbi:MAG: hypothetical protein AAGB51_11535 [Planctomycetota bacterium]
MPPTAALEDSRGSRTFWRTATRSERYERDSAGQELRIVGLGDASSILTRDQYLTASEEFLEAAVQLRRASDAGASSLLKVRAIDRARAEVALAWFPITVADAIRASVAPSDAAIRVIVDAGLSAIEQMIHLRDRAHGAIAAENVYLDTSGITPRASIGLCAPSSEVSQSGSVAADLWDLGRLIFELVNRSPYSELGAWPLASGAAWDALGSSGEAWRGLCNDLLNPDASKRPSVSRAIEMLRTVPEVREHRKKSGWIWGLGAAALVAVGSGGYLASHILGKEGAVVVPDGWNSVAERQWRELCEKTEAWFLRLATELPGAAAVDNEHINTRVLGPIASAREAGSPLDPRTIAGREDRVDRRTMAVAGSIPPAAQTQQAIDNTATALEIVRAVEAALSPEGWPDLSRVIQHAGSWRERGWRNASSALEARVEAAQPMQGAALAAAIDALVNAHQASSATEDNWASVSGVSNDLEALDDPLLSRFRAFAESEAAITDSPEGLAERTAELAQLGRELLATSLSRLPEIDAALLREEIAAYQVDAPDEGDFRAWLTAAVDPVYTRFDLSIDPHPADALSEQRLELAARISAAPGDGIDATAPELRSIQARADSLESEILTLASRPWNRRTSDALRADATAIREGLATLARDTEDLEAAARMDPTAYIETLRAQASIVTPPSVTLDGAWQARRDAAILAFESDGNRLAFLRLIGDAQQEIRDLSDRVPLAQLAAVRPSRLDSERFLSAFTTLRETALAESLAADGESTGLLSFETLADSAREMLADMSLAEELLDDLRGTDEPDTENRTAGGLIESWLTRPEFTSLSGETVFADLIGLYRGVAAAERSDAPDSLIQDSELTDPIRFAAWRRLDSAGLTDTTAAGFASATEIGRELAARLDDEARRADIFAEVQLRTSERWGRLCLGAENSVELSAMLDSGMALGLNPADAPDRTTAYNATLHAFSEAFKASLDDDIARQQTEAFLAALDAGADTDLARALRELLDPERDIGPGANPARLGPGTAGWALTEAATDNTRVVYGFPARAPVVSMAFSVVFPEGQDPVYLAEQELSVGTLGTVASDRRAWNELGGFDTWLELAEQRSGGGGSAAWTGPRSWRWAGSQFARNVSWVFRHPTMSQDANGLIPLIAPGTDPAQNPPPRVEHPVQWISPAAAQAFVSLIGCDIPTALTWEAARRAELATGAEGVPNLRDRAWEQQRDYTISRRGEGRQAEWPDGGVFDDTDAPTRASASALDSVDGVVWFTRASEGPGVVFKNLVGNVAEFVVMDDGSTGVIGSSALSPWGPEDAGIARPVDGASPSGWSDVGLRPAFDATGVRFQRPLAAEVASLLDPPPYVLGGN